jgi:diadenosine tetraphosphate (Ap4A) HIT family hydrolase
LGYGRAYAPPYPKMRELTTGTPKEPKIFVMKTKDFLGNEWDIACMGCAISDNSMSVPGDFIQTTKYFCVHQDPLIPLSGFLVIGSLRHIQSISDMQKSEYEEFSNLLGVTHFAIKKATGIENITIIQEESSSHFHLWFFPWSPDVIEKYGEPSLAKIRVIMADYKSQTIDEVRWRELEESIKRIRQYSREK